ncbi:uncharacterized protein TRIVIDRAFT_191922 [Trichoderma virens Gv29-8]|uniref:Major facilitator superfamily (MFS) profile domain-containing protein n=1 Tax=Hypocrea virens (strain Gv29-8 / FGSC 10586) TaxID=413071 RepID=G9MUV4_HYPVG|nr:uncharacterized protein TRIVIDRAFT_191922 [Trichoderma virens Gv29-8]EHK21769.1 hypothetical protein TRIVIDRAFT_191922 [Trichoderma virens Gv29-8]
MTEKSKDSSQQRLSIFSLVLGKSRVTNELLEFPYAGSGTQDDPYVVNFIPDDAGNPYNWSTALRCVITIIAGGGTLATSFASTAFTGTLFELESDLGASTELITAAVSLFVLGFAVGPLLWAPLSEMYGRRIIFVITFGAFTAFNAGCAGANTTATILALRFFAGAFGSSTLTNTAGTALSLFVLMPVVGPTLGPLCGGFLGEKQGWRWVAGMIAIVGGVVWILGTLFIPETYATVILRRRAAELSQITNKTYVIQLDINGRGASVGSLLKTSLTRPWVFLFKEPIVSLLSLYMAIIYGTLYLFFGAFPVIYQLDRHWSEGIGGLPFLGGSVGLLCAAAFSFWTNKKYKEIAKMKGGIVPPETRLIPASPSIHWVSSVLANVPFGFGLLVVFSSITNYLIDSYLIFAASAIAANTVLRSLFGAAFPLFTPYMYQSLGIHWASSVPAFLSLACVPLPFIFYKYGAKIRKRCTYAS